MQWMPTALELGTASHAAFRPLQALRGGHAFSLVGILYPLKGQEGLVLLGQGSHRPAHPHLCPTNL